MRADKSGWVYQWLPDENIEQAVCFFENPEEAKTYAEKKNAQNKNNWKRCKCGHDHIEWVGDLGEYHDEEGYYQLSECAECDCESYEEEKQSTVQQRKQNGEKQKMNMNEEAQYEIKLNLLNDNNRNRGL